MHSWWILGCRAGTVDARFCGERTLSEDGSLNQRASIRNRLRISISEMKGFALLVVAVLLAIGAGVGAEATLGPTSNFHASFYPLPVEGAPRQYLAQCPDPSGLESFSYAARQQAIAITKTFTTMNFNDQSIESDPSFWARLATMKFGVGQGSGSAASKAQLEGPLRGGPAYFLIENSCGARLVQHTQTVVLIPLLSNGQEQSCNACRTHYYFIDRHSRALLYFMF